MLIARIPRLLQRLYKSATWEIPTSQKTVYLTFDDGPTPGVTDWVLDLLEKHNAVATFFCLGRNVEEHPEVFSRIRERGHEIGNHSYSHMKGFSNSLEDYLGNIEQAAELIPSKLFRPPYGRILPFQAKEIARKYQVVMWTVLSVDYNPRISGEQVVRNVLDNISPGSIVVFHDSMKASKNLYHALPVVMEHLDREGYKTALIPQSR